jgi:hypothetical protein
MKVTNWRRKLLASLVAGGMMAPVAASAADLNTNLIVDPSFEDVDPANAGPFTSNRLLSWPDSAADGNATDDNWAFRFAQNYAGVNTPAGAGARYFSGGFGTTAGQPTLAQSVSVGTGQTGTAIAAGEAAYRLSGFFSSYLGQADASSLRLRFLNAGGTEISRTSVGGFDFVQNLGFQTGTFGQHRDWGQDSRSGFVPSGTSSVAVEIVSDITAGNHDGYTDLVDFRIVNASDILLFLEVNTTTGQTRIKNLTGAPVNIDYYEITSASGALSATAWSSLQEQNLAGFPAGNGSGNGWEQFGGASSRVVGESYLRGNSTVVNNASIVLGAAYTVGGTHDLVFQYSVVTGATSNPTGDYNSDGRVDAADYVVWRKTNINGQQGYADWRTNFGATGASGGPGTLNSGFVRYVTSGIGAGAAVPEPAGVWLVGIGLASLAIGSRRKP